MSEQFGPFLDPWIKVHPAGFVDPEQDAPWTIEYIRTFHDFIKYKPTAVEGVGRIYFHGTNSSGQIEEYRAQGEPIIIVDQLPDMDTHYVDIAAQKVMPKAPSTAKLTGYVIRGLPPGAEIVIDGQDAYPADDDSVELEFDYVGTYRIEVRSPTQLTAAFEVTWK
jgi:hypothetical protein